MAESIAPEWFRMSMVERVARAMCSAAMIDPDWCGEPLSAKGNRPQWRHKEALARAAIAAMREPNLAMRKVVSFKEAEITWPAMIDAALAPPAPSQTDGDA